jgi:hypothetical protein
MAQSLNLILIHAHGWQAAEDFEAIRAYVEDMAPDIEVFIVPIDSRSSLTRKKSAQRPTLVFSPLALREFQPVRGKVYAGRAMSKLIEMQRLQAGGLRVPAFEELRPDTALDPATYGPHVIVKPAYELASWGKNIRLFKREDVRYRAPADYPEGHHGRKGPMIAQRFIDCGRTMNCRVLTFFGVPIFSYCRRSTKPLDLGNLSQPFRQRDFMPAAPNIEIHVTRDPDILALAASAYQALPEIPLQACDILRAKDDRLYILEVNPGGGTWMFSSKAAPAYKKALGVDDLTTEFDAFETCARILVERTRAEAI